MAYNGNLQYPTATQGWHNPYGPPLPTNTQENYAPQPTDISNFGGQYANSSVPTNVSTGCVYGGGIAGATGAGVEPGAFVPGGDDADAEGEDEPEGDNAPPQEAEHVGKGKQRATTPHFDELNKPLPSASGSSNGNAIASSSSSTMMGNNNNSSGSNVPQFWNPQFGNQPTANNHVSHTSSGPVPLATGPANISVMDYINGEGYHARANVHLPQLGSPVNKSVPAAYAPAGALNTGSTAPPQPSSVKYTEGYSPWTNPASQRLNHGRNRQHWPMMLDSLRNFAMIPGAEQLGMNLNSDRNSFHQFLFVKDRMWTIGESAHGVDILKRRYVAVMQTFSEVGGIWGKGLNDAMVRKAATELVDPCNRTPIMKYRETAPASGEDLGMSAQDWGSFIGLFVRPRLRLISTIPYSIQQYDPLVVPLNAGLDALMCLRALNEQPVSHSQLQIILHMTTQIEYNQYARVLQIVTQSVSLNQYRDIYTPL